MWEKELRQEVKKAGLTEGLCRVWSARSAYTSGPCLVLWGIATVQGAVAATIRDI